MANTVGATAAAAPLLGAAFNRSARTGGIVRPGQRSSFKETARVANHLITRYTNRKRYDAGRALWRQP